MLTPQQRAELLRVARESVSAATGQRPYAPTSDDPVLRQPGAAFVTLKKRGQLRGCIGMLEAREPLIECVANMARAAALEDYRFPQVEPAEVPELSIDISILSPAQRVKDVSEIQVGVHGLIVEDGPRRGLLLPQVAQEYGWTREEFLDQCCLKAGLPKGQWRKGAQVYSFCAEVFGDE
jgi:AmmeMemoRadiSam system protein A